VIYFVQSNTHTEFLITVDGRKVVIDEIMSTTSFDLYQTAEHYQICHSMAALRTDDPVVQQVLMNLFALKSHTARKATALSAFLRRAEITVASMCINPSVKAALPIELTKSIQLIEWDGTAEKLIAWNHIGLLLAKAVLHQLFRCLPTNVPHRPNLVRAWVDVSAKLYPEEIKNGLVLIYPFALNMLRQWRFISWCRKEGVHFRLAGMPYKIFRILFDIVIGRPNDLILAHAEIVANERHACELQDFSPQHIFTSDEFETGSFLLYRSLIKSGVKVVNTAHGIGNYCPNIAYTEFRVITSSQSDFYVQRNHNIHYKLLSNEGRVPRGLSHYTLSKGNPAAIILIHQSFELTQQIAEECVQLQIDAELERVSQVLGIKYIIKMHPNTRKVHSESEQVDFKGELVYEWSVLADFRPIFVTINSTAFLDVRGAGPALAFAGTTFDPSLYFGPSIMTFTLQNAESILKFFLQEDIWMKAASYHAKDSSVSPLHDFRSKELT
jgi:hypothetical protein